MSATIDRPVFFNGKILGAADLTATVDYPRNQMARHSRYVHSWGIVTGLELTADYKVTVGIAIDGTGREVVVPAQVPLPPFDIASTGLPSATLYPVYLSGVDQAAAPSSSLTGACGSAQSSSTTETYQITFGSPGSELAVAEQTPPAITDGTDDGISGTWLILLGFVTWQSGNFTSVANTNPANNVGRQYVGVNAAQVISGSGVLLLATDAAGAPASNAVMAVKISETPPQLQFGKLNADGSVTPGLTVSANGDVVATGKVSGTSIPVKVQVQSGIACDGMILPLPLGIDPSNTEVYVQVSARIDLNTQPPSGMGTSALAFPYECTVDPATRRVSCRMQWWDTTSWAAGPVIAPAPCDYLIVAAAN